MRIRLDEPHVHPEGCLCEWDGQRRSITGSIVRIDDTQCPLHGRSAGGFPSEREPWHDPSLVLGSTGPQRVSSDGGDPDVEPPRIRGFGEVVLDPLPVIAAIEAGSLVYVGRGPGGWVAYGRPLTPIAEQDPDVWGDQA